MFKVLVEGFREDEEEDEEDYEREEGDPVRFFESCSVGDDEDEQSLGCFDEDGAPKTNARSQRILAKER